MEAFRPASIVVIPFPFSDLSQSKLRPTVVLAKTSLKDYLLRQITSNAYIDPEAIRITNDHLREGKLNTTSYARPLKLFTANEDLIVKPVAVLDRQTFNDIISVIINTLTENLPT